MVVWEEGVLPSVHGDVGLHAALTYDSLATAGPPARPLEFPTPTVHRGTRRDVIALDHRTGRFQPVTNALMRCGTSSPPERAYLIKKKLSNCVYGVVRLCVVLKKRSPPPPSAAQSNVTAAARRRRDGEIRDEQVEWESTGEYAVVKASSWAKIRALRGRHLEDPIKEVSAMQLVGNNHPNVQGALEVLQDDEYLYTIMPYCSGGSLYGRIMGDGRRRSPREAAGFDESSLEHAGCSVDEAQARTWFRQLLSGLFHLQRKGVCHRDISLENVMVDENDHLVILDLGMSLRVPYADPDNMGCVTDVSGGTERLLIQAQGQGGNLMYIAPEVVAREETFDGFAIDIWAAGVVLFVLLVGMSPFEFAVESDRRYSKIARGHLRELMHSLNIPLSEEACDLLQNMFWRDPRRRLTLAQIMQHPWVNNKKFNATTPTVPKETKNETKPPRAHKTHWRLGVPKIRGRQRLPGTLE